MHEKDGAQLPIVQTFGEELERVMAGRSRARRRSSRRRSLALAFAAALLATSLLSAPGRAASEAVGEWLGLADPGDPPTAEAPRERGASQERPWRSMVLASGHAPDGVRYEFVLERFTGTASPDPSVEDFRHCVNIEWPDAPVGPIEPQFGCYESFPPADLNSNAVRWGGAMFDTTRTGHVQIAGLAGSGVSDVRIRYKDEHGIRRDAEVGFAEVSGEVLERAGADRPFGVFIGFLPRTWMGYGARFDFRECPPGQNPYDSDAIEVIAYDQHDEVIARQTGNNINSVSGRPIC